MLLAIGPSAEPDRRSVLASMAVLPGALVLPQAGALVLPQAGALMLPQAGALVLPQAGALVLPQAGALVLPQAGALVLPQAGALVLPQPGAACGGSTRGGAWRCVAVRWGRAAAAWATHPAVARTRD